MTRTYRQWLESVIARRPARGSYEFCSLPAEADEIATDLEAAGFKVERKQLAGRHVINFEAIES